MTASTSSVFAAPPVFEMPPAREEEQEYEEESDYENDEKIDPSLRSQCLPLDTLLPDFETEEPVDGFEYLRRVRYEAAKIPNVVVSDVNPRDYDNKRSPKILEKHGFITSSAKALGRAKTMRILEHARANAEWTKQFLASFSNLRVSMRHVLDTEEEKIEKNKRQPKINRKYIAPEKLEAVPLMSDVVALDDVTVSALFRKYCYAFTEKEEEDERENEKLKHAWFFALAVRVSMPLDGETQAAVRRVSRVFAKQLSSSFNEEPNDEDNDEDENAGRIAALNIGLSIAWKYFNQPPFDDNEKEDDEDNELDHIDRKLGRIL